MEFVRKTSKRKRHYNNKSDKFDANREKLIAEISLDKHKNKWEIH